MDIKFVTVILPLMLPELLTYSVPESLKNGLKPGMRVEVGVRNKLYSAIVYETHETLDLPYKTKPIISVIDHNPIITEKQLQFWMWIARYYCCTPGEVMKVALPSGLKLESETKVLLNGDPSEIDTFNLSDEEYLIVEAITVQHQLTISQIQDILNKKSIYPIIRGLIDQGIIAIMEELKEKYKPKSISFLTLNEPYRSNPEKLTEVFDKIAKSEKQTRLLLAFVQLSKNKTFSIPASDIYTLSGGNSSIARAMAKKDVFTIEKKTISRIKSDVVDEGPSIPPLSPMQITALEEIKGHFQTDKPVLIHGITGSGKTRVYTELINETMQSGKQTLYLLPEIALTTHMVERLKNELGQDILVYHSRLSNHERVEIWNAILLGAKVVIGARSSLFLPFTNLGLIIVDEEHDPSYKQFDPNPRYNARDAAIYLANRNHAKIILGSATPSMESYVNATAEKYGLVEMTERHGTSVLPEMQIVDLREAYKDQSFKGIFSPTLLSAIEEALAQKEQVILFQNRRGYAPILECQLCGWTAECINCDVKLTKHKAFNELRCHYCGSRSKLPEMCPACGNTHLSEAGMGTEKIEESLAAIFPEARIARMDYDTAKTKTALESIMVDFELRKIDILVGTQMITKGLDFDNISLVGVLNADSLLKYPDLRSNERAFQLLTQVAGRAGRRQKQGKVIIQTFSPGHPIIVETTQSLYGRFFKRESGERHMFRYPPYYRMIQLEFLHKNAEVVAKASAEFARLTKKQLGERVLGPAVPSVARIRGYYINTITVKMEKNNLLTAKIKDLLLSTSDTIKKIEPFKNVRINIDVDPY